MSGTPAEKEADLQSPTTQCERQERESCPTLKMVCNVCGRKRRDDLANHLQYVSLNVDIPTDLQDCIKESGWTCNIERTPSICMISVLNEKSEIIGEDGGDWINIAAPGNIQDIANNAGLSCYAEWNRTTGEIRIVIIGVNDFAPQIAIEILSQIIEFRVAAQEGAQNGKV